VPGTEFRRVKRKIVKGLKGIGWRVAEACLCHSPFAEFKGRQRQVKERGQGRRGSFEKVAGAIKC
jgi:hypothetical protein